jgi:hypothetical protein
MVPATTLLLFVIFVIAPRAFGARSEITNVDAVPHGDTVRINIELTSPARPLMRLADSPSRLILLFQNVSSPNLPRRLQINLGGVSEIRTVGSDSAQAGSTIIVGMDSARPFEIEPSGNTLVVRIFSHFVSANTDVQRSPATPWANRLPPDSSRDDTSANAVKHSGVRQFAVELQGTVGEIQLTVSDQGVGFDSRDAINRHGLGLISM